MSGILHFYSNFDKIMLANIVDPDQTPHSVASDLDLQSLPMSHKEDARLIWDHKIV